MVKDTVISEGRVLIQNAGRSTRPGYCVCIAPVSYTTVVKDTVLSEELAIKTLVDALVQGTVCALLQYLKPLW